MKKTLILLLFVSIFGLSCSDKNVNENVFLGNWANKSQIISIEKDNDSGIFYVTDKNTQKVYKAKYSSFNNSLMIDLEVTNQPISVKDNKIYSSLFGQLEKQ